MNKRVRTKKKAGPYLVDILRHTNNAIIEAYLDSDFSVDSCGGVIGPEGLARHFVYERNKVVVAGYLKSFKTIDHRDYSITDDRWETLRIIPKKDRKKLEQILKKHYEIVEFWD